MNCTCCLRRNVLPLNCNCPRPGLCRECLKCPKHCGCGGRARLPGCSRPKPPAGSGDGRGETPPPPAS